MDYVRCENYFPQQKVSNAEKQKPKWYCNCIDYVISMGVACNDMGVINDQIRILHGDIPNEYYKKTLNPYNATNEKNQRFPATMRNLDIMSDIIRRYVGEYSKSPHDVVVGSNDPQFVINKNFKLKQAVMELCQRALIKEIQRRVQEKQQELQQQQEEQQEEQGVQAQQSNSPSTGGQEITPQDVISEEEIKQFIEKFNEDYIDEQTVNGEKLLAYIKDKTHDEELYTETYYNFVSFGRCFTYRNIENGEITKECVPVTEAYPIPTRDKYIEDQDMFARRFKMSRQQIFDKFGDNLTEKDKAFFEKYYNHDSSSETRLLNYTGFFETYPDVCDKFTDKERKHFREGQFAFSDANGDLFDVWHVVWKSFKRVGILTYTNEIGMIDTMTVEDGFKFDKELGHISIEWLYVPQVYEGYRIGGRFDGVYPIKARPIAQYSHDAKLPYNGLLEPFPMMGSFSIIDIIAPYQIMRNIISYHIEMTIAKNKMLLLLVPQSLIEDRFEDRIYRMAADGVLLYDDSVDANNIKAQQLRMLNANLGDYIRQLIELKEDLKNEAREMVDMTAQRYGEIATSAGKGTTEEAIARGSMGSVSINFSFDNLRCRDYQSDIDSAKIAYANGLDDGYFDAEKTPQHISLTGEEILFSDLSVLCKNSQKEKEKLEQFKQFAFSAAQNGDMDMAVAAITGDSVNSMKILVNRFNELKRQHENELKQADIMLKQEEIQNRLKEIMAKGEEDRKTEELKYYYEMQLKYIDTDVSILGDPDAAAKEKNASAERIEAVRRDIERMKLEIERQKIASADYNAAADRNVRREKMQNDLKIAKTNKNKYDK